MKHLFASLVLVFSSLSLAQIQAQSPDEPSVMVKKLYAVQSAGSPLFHQTKDRAVLDRFFQKGLADAIWKDAGTADGEMGALDFDPLSDSQDPQMTDFTIMKTRKDGDKKTGGADQAIVPVTFKNAGAKQKISFQFTRDQSGVWKISDIRYSDGRRLAKILGGTAGNP